MLPRRFALVRHVDYTGVSGVGVVAYGVVFADGHVALRWPSEHPATSLWNSLDDLLAVHGHGEATSVEWLDPPDETTTDERRPPGRRARRTPPTPGPPDSPPPAGRPALSTPSQVPVSSAALAGHTGVDGVRVPPQRRVGRHRRVSTTESFPAEPFPTPEPFQATEPIESD